MLVPFMIVLLAGVDIVGAIAAKSWARTPGVWVFLAWSATYLLLFWIYAPACGTASSPPSRSVGW